MERRNWWADNQHLEVLPELGGGGGGGGEEEDLVSSVPWCGEASRA